MEFYTLASSSAGNAALVCHENTRVLIDAGISCRRIAHALAPLGLATADLDGILLTHEHIDHVRGLRVFLKKYRVPVYASEGTCSAILEQGLVPEGAELKVLGAAGTQAAGIQVRPFHTSHDCREGYGYVMSFPDGRTAALSTDLGYLSKEVTDAVSGCDLVVIESNHDVRMLQNGSYPYPLKRRILSDIGHLSNESCAEILPQLIRKGSTRFVLAHLSRENNLPELALETSRAELKQNGMRENFDYVLTVAPRENTTGHISIF